MSNGSYSWEQVMLGIDVQNESLEKARQQEDIETKRTKEANAASSWSLGLSILGAAIFGPIGYMAGKNIGKYGADWGWFDPGDKYSDWEKMSISEGKFDKEISRKANRILKDAATNQTNTQALNTLTDLATMYVQAGGLKEGFDPTSWREWTTFGTGEDAWSVFGKKAIGTPGSESWVDEFGTEFWDVTEASPDYKPAVPSIFEGGYKPLGKLSDLSSPIDKLVKS